jgi:glycosyltransferase involved in cell wall biosynthesis
MISVIIPCYNEAKTIELIVEKVLAIKQYNIEIIIIDDFSNDGTTEILKTKLTSKIRKILYNEKNFGKGYCIRKGIEKSNGDIILIQDADLEYNPQDYHKLLNPILNGDADVVFGSRFLGGEEKRVLFFWHSLANKILTLISNMCSDINLTDMETCYKVFKSSLIKKIELKENRFGFEPEITAKIAKLKPKIYEVGISYHGRTYEEGKKIGLKDAFNALKCIIKYNFFKN